MKSTPFYDFLTELFDKGKIVFGAAPRDRPSTAGVAFLAEVFEAYRLAIAGPQIAFDPAIAVAAAEFLRQSAWALVNHDDRVTDLVKRLKMPCLPLTPSHHLSADLTLHHLPQVLRRARGLDSSDPMVAQVANELRNWPLTGVLSDVEEGPRVALDFGGHPGLKLMYAERLVGNDRPSWRPITDGPSWNHYELVRGEHGQIILAVDGNEVHGG